MEKLQQAENILMHVVSTMDTICITGLENQDKFVGCANAIQEARKMILSCIADQQQEEPNAG